MLPVVLAGCAGLTKEPPLAVALPASFATALSTARPPVDLATYWQSFGDPTLDQLVEQAIARNYTLKAARDVVTAAAASGAATTASLLPSITAAGSVQQEKLSSIGQPLPGPSPGKVTSAAGVGFGWVLPLFGRFGATEKGVAGVLGIAQAERNAAQVAVVAQVATAYVDLRADQQRERLLQAELAASTHIVRLVTIQAGAGIASQLDVARAHTHADELALKLPGARLAIATDIQRLAMLEGQTAPDAALDRPRPIPPAPQAYPAIVPADLLRLRPQIIQAEAEVATNAASLGIAIADLLPQFTLGGSLSIFAGNGFLDPLTGTKLPDKLSLFEVGPGVTIPLLDWGQRYHSAKAAQANLAASIEHYHEAVVEGVGAVDIALAGITAADRQVAAAAQEQRSALSALNSGEILFGRGLTDLSTLLDSEQQRETADLDANDAAAAADIAVINLYEALGGGLQMAP